LHQISGTALITFEYDNNGNIRFENTSPHLWTYQYDGSNQLVSVLYDGNEIAAYTYNGAGQRIKKVAGGATRIFHYDLWGHLIAETDQNGTMVAEYIYLGDQLLAMIRPGNLVYYFHNDHLGTPQVLTDSNGNIAWRATYDPFGEATITVQAVENPFRFPGQYYGQETGLHYNYFRYYDPTTGRYVTPDPIGLAGGINLWPYAAGNPVRFADPKGLLIGPWHFVVTYAAARNSGRSVSDSLKLAWDVAGEDRSSLSKDADAANIHGMRGTLEIGPGEFRYQTPSEALSGTIDIVRRAAPLSSALHALQDLPGHNLESMEDFGLNWSTVKHVFRDILDIFWMYESYQNTKKFLKAMQPCK
jgi:RHS repeat-associated protein